MSNTYAMEALECDVLVVGSGAAGLATAVSAAHEGLEVIVAEQDAFIGGTTAWSGGWMWVPHNPLAVRAGIVEPEADPKRYLWSELGSRSDDVRIDAYLATGPEMVRFFEEKTAVEFIAGNAIPDFHTTDGHAEGGRSISVRPFNARELGPWIDKLRPPLDIVSLMGMGIAGGADMAHFFNATRSPRSALHAARRLIAHFRDLALHGRGMHLVNGNALVARLLRSALDRDVTVLTEAAATRLLSEQGAVVGAEIGGLKPRRIIARRGVVLATGGFPHDRARISALFQHAPTGTEHHSAAPQTNVGEGLRLGEAAGGTIDIGLASPAAWAPVSLVRRGNGTTAVFPHLVERAKPGFMAVLPDGRRFVNEADSYHDFMVQLFEAWPGTGTPYAWLICDHKAHRRFGLGWSKPFPFPPALYVRNGYLKRAATLAELAGICGIDASQLEATVAAFNADARQGEDSQFGRGKSAYNRTQGDPHQRPNPALGPLETAPFYAVRIVPGSLGTFAGLMTDASARVLGRNGLPISGLFAVGNDMSSIMGGHYPSGGITLGPAMVFGYIAGRELAKPHPKGGNQEGSK